MLAPQHEPRGEFLRVLLPRLHVLATVVCRVSREEYLEE